MHSDDVVLDIRQVEAMLAAQCPQWADAPLVPLATGGTDHALFRLGDAFLVRLPRRPSAAPQVRKEARWLPKLGGDLPLAIPAPGFWVRALRTIRSTGRSMTGWMGKALARMFWRRMRRPPRPWRALWWRCIGSAPLMVRWPVIRIISAACR